MQDDDGGERRCDFCGATQPTRVYPCRDFVRDEEVVLEGELGVRPHRFVGNWAACTDCDSTYETGGVDALADRVAEQYAERDPLVTAFGVKDRLRSEVRRLYMHFEMHRDGNPYAYQ